MSLAQILYPPPTDQGLEEWFYAHAQHHSSILQAYKDTHSVLLNDLGLYPVQQKDMQDWLRRHQQMHNEMCQVAGVAATDLGTLDFTKKKDADAWFFQHFLQHQGVAEASGQPI